MENSKKVILAFGLALSVVCGGYTIQAMETTGDKQKKFYEDEVWSILSREFARIAQDKDLQRLLGNSGYDLPDFDMILVRLQELTSVYEKIETLSEVFELLSHHVYMLVFNAAASEDANESYRASVISRKLFNSLILYHICVLMKDELTKPSPDWHVLSLLLQVTKQGGTNLPNEAFKVLKQLANTKEGWRFDDALDFIRRMQKEMSLNDQLRGVRVREQHKREQARRRRLGLPLLPEE